jgi:large subunit ribosomal protein L24
MAMHKIKKDDVVIVLAGDDKGKKGRVLRIVKKEKAIRVIVEGINLRKKHVKANPQANEKGGIVAKEASMVISNIALAASIKGSKKTSKVGFKFLEDGSKVRYFKSNNELVDI